MAFSNARGDTSARPLREGHDAKSSPPAPETLTAEQPGSQGDLVRKMGALLVLERPDSTAEALRLLRQEFPNYPLALRLAALATSMRNWP